MNWKEVCNECIKSVTLVSLFKLDNYNQTVVVQSMYLWSLIADYNLS